MLSVKHITTGAVETIHQSTFARFVPAYDERDANVKNGDELPCPSVVTDGMTITGGTVFVMNDAGKTVARYDLGASNVPLGCGN